MNQGRRIYSLIVLPAVLVVLNPILVAAAPKTLVPKNVVPGIVASGTVSSKPFVRHLKYLDLVENQDSMIGQIMKDRKLGRLEEDTLNVQIMLGRLYLSQGLHFQAGQVFQELIDQKSISKEQLGEVWFYLAKSYYFMGYLEQAEAALKKVAMPVDAQLRAEVQHYHLLVYLAADKYQQATAFMKKYWWQAPGNWDLYARYNFALALIGDGKLNAGMEMLEHTGLKRAQNDEAVALIDKVNQALGYLLLQQNQPQKARQFLERVKLQGEYSNLALLGAGWASAMSQQYQQALVPWFELSRRDQRETSVQEAMLVVPYAYEQLGLVEQSMDFYEQAVDGFELQLAMIEQAMTALRNDQLPLHLKQLPVEDESAWTSSLQKESQQPALYYLKQFMQEKEFFQVMKNYREARILLLDANNKLATIEGLSDQPHKNVKASKDYKTKAGRKQVLEIEMLTANLLKRSDQLAYQASKHMAKYSKQLKAISLDLLEQKKQRLDVYLVQARLALAQTYESAGIE